MKGAPGFSKWPDAVDGMWKISLLRWLGREMKIETLIETGTCEGVTPFNLKDDFKEIHTIELHNGLYEGARRWLAPYKHVYCYHGSSRMMLRHILSDLHPQPILFWLDAHSSGPHTADDGNPLPDEVRVITALCPEALIVIDDQMGYDQFVGQMTDVDISGWTAEFRTGEILIYRPERYTIPPFEA